MKIEWIYIFLSVNGNILMENIVDEKKLVQHNNRSIDAVI